MRYSSCLRYTALLFASFVPDVVSADVEYNVGSVDYSQGANQLAEMLRYVTILMTNTLLLCEALGALVAIISALQIYIKIQAGEEGVKKNIMILVGACVFLVAASIFFPALFGYSTWSS